MSLAFSDDRPEIPDSASVLNDLAWPAVIIHRQIEAARPVGRGIEALVDRLDWRTARETCGQRARS
jgi:hypothetical protein